MLPLLFMMLMFNSSWASGSETQNCSISVTVPRGTQFNIMPGTSIMLQCPVLYCTEQPAMSWYRYNEVSQMFLILQQEQRHSVSWINESTFVLNFASFYKNDSGSYHCEATMKKQKWKSHVIQVSVQDPNNLTKLENANNTIEGHGATEKTKAILLFVLPSLGVLCLLAFCFSGLHCFIRKRQVKNKMNSSSSEHEMNVVLDGDAVYGNQDICRKATPNPTCNESVTSAHQLKSENQDTLVYATLSHGEPLQKSEPLLETVFSEYATIGMEQ
ncbi:B- and T-lymphocyte attenuator [Varanus komodoensis]|uniref:B- and T-lymphocyte attenuator n=1 Tax=Varanus komodoensis TaxID=61221 RepID=UPI001CF7D569|nr:B- and T-lymphocyte attenuator [Varanus komodoensis]